MSEFKAGQRVHVEFDGTVKCTYHFGDRMIVNTDNGSLGTVDTEWVTLADPKDWPPRVGDIWEADGQEYHAEAWKRKTCDPVNIVLQPYMHSDDTFAYSDESLYAKNLGDFKALNPVLVRRRKA